MAELSVQAIGFGVVTGAVIAIGAMGFTLQFGLTNVLNISYGGVMTAVRDVKHVGQAELQRESHRADRDQRAGDDAEPDRLNGEFSHTSGA